MSLFDYVFHGTTASHNQSRSRGLKWIGSLLLTAALVGLCAPDVQAQQQGQPQKGEVRPAPNPELTYDRPSGVSAKATELFKETFEGEVSPWDLSGSEVWGIGAPTVGPDMPFEGENVAGTVLDGEYPNEADGRLVSPEISLPSLDEDEELVFSFFEWYEIESEFDEGSVEITTDGGETWETVETRDGATGGWRAEQIVLTEFEGENVQLGFRLSTDESETNAGWYIDDLLVFTTEAPPLDVSITSLNAGRFPFVFSNVQVSSFEEPEPGLTKENFTATEDDVVQENRFDVTPPSEGESVRFTDIVFVIDETGSMGDEIADVRDNVISFVDGLKSEGVNFNLGLITYGDEIRNLALDGTLTADAEEFQSLVGDIGVFGGGDFPENGVGALQTALSEYTFRPGSQKVFILVTDAPSHLEGDGRAGDDDVDPTPVSLEEITTRLQNAGVTTHAAAIDDPIYTGVGSVTEATGGKFFNVRDPLDEILEDVGSTVANNYVVRYRAENEERDGMRREVEIEAEDASGSDAATAFYTPGAAPEIERTEETRTLANRSEDEDVTIEAVITDRADPPLESATLFYKSVDDETFNSVNMEEAAGSGEDTFEATIPASDLSAPGIDYYITATDGVTTTSSPSTSPRDNAWQFGVENESPSVDHDPVEAYTPGTSISISAEVSDDEAVEAVEVFFRAFGELAYRSREMTTDGGGSTTAKDGTFEAEIPAEAVTESGVEYYISAVDNSGVRNSSGNLDEPNRSLFPAPPVEVNSSTSGGEEVTLDWPAPSETGLSEYRVYRDDTPIDTSEGAPADLSPVGSVEATSTTFAEMPEPGHTYYYRVTAVSESEEESAVSTQERVFLYPESVAAEVNRTFGDASGPDDYRLISIPGESQSLEGVLDGEAGVEWQAFWDDGSDFVKFDGSDTFSVGNGRGFWLTNRGDWTFNDEVSTVELQGDTVSTIPLHSGWNIISNPYEKDVDWSTVEEFNEEGLSDLFAFDGGFSTVSTFEAGASGEAYYFLNEDDLDQLVVPYPDAPFEGDIDVKSKQDSAQSTLEIVAERVRSDGTVQATSNVRVGVDKRAKPGRDELDVVAPPSDFSTVSLRIEDREKTEASRQQALVADYRPSMGDGQTFDLHIESNGPVRLRAEGLDDLGREITVFRPSDGSSFDVRTDDAIEIHPNEGGESLKLAVGSEAYVEQQQEQLLPDEVKLTTYPNPVRRQGTIEFALPEAQEVSLTVYDMLGREVATLAQGRKRAGTHTVQLETGELSSGMYFGRLEAGDRTMTQKITVVR